MSVHNLLWFFTHTDIMQKQVIFEDSAAEPFKMSMLFWLLLNLLGAHGGKSIHGVSMLRWHNYQTFDNNSFTVKENAARDQQTKNQVFKLWPGVKLLQPSMRMDDARQKLQSKYIQSYYVISFLVNSTCTT